MFFFLIGSCYAFDNTEAASSNIYLIITGKKWQNIFISALTSNVPLCCLWFCPLFILPLIVRVEFSRNICLVRTAAVNHTSIMTSALKPRCKVLLVCAYSSVSTTASFTESSQATDCWVFSFYEKKCKRLKVSKRNSKSTNLTPPMYVKSEGERCNVCPCVRETK